MTPLETYFVTTGGVTVICHDKDNVLEWVEFILGKGLVPNVERMS